MNNCLDCKHQKVSFSDISLIEEGFVHYKDKMYLKCKLGYQDKILKFYQENGSKIRTDIHDEFECYESTKTKTQLEKVLRQANNLLKEIKNK